MSSSVHFAKSCIFIYIVSFDLHKTLWGQLGRDCDGCFYRCKESGSESLNNFLTVVVTHLQWSKAILGSGLLSPNLSTFHQDRPPILDESTAWFESVVCWFLWVRGGFCAEAFGTLLTFWIWYGSTNDFFLQSNLLPDPTHPPPF